MRAAAIVLVGIVGCRPLPDGRTAVEHEHEAQRLRSEADAARAAVTTQENARPTPTGVEQQMDPGTPLAGAAQGRAGYVVAQAQKHEETARRIREDADVACARVPASRWRSCPLGEPTAAEPIAMGVRLKLASPVEAEGMRDEMRCAVARAHVERPDEEARCPLLVTGAEARVVDVPGGQAIEIVAQDQLHADEVRMRARKLLQR